MIYQTLHTPPITPEELYRLETLLKNLKGVNISEAAMSLKNLEISYSFSYSISTKNKFIW